MNSRLFTVNSVAGEAPPAPDTPTNTSRDFGKILENVYKPGFIDQDTLENTKMAIDRELGEISKAFFQTTERTTDGIKRVDQIVIETEDLSARIEEVDQVSKAGDIALASRITTVETEYQAADANLSASITTESTARSSADSALASQITSVDAAYKEADTTIRSSITTETNARVSADSALSSQITTVEAELGADIAAVQTYATTNINRIDGEVNAVEAKWGVRVNVNNKVTGIQLNNDGNQTSFAVQADQFIISDGTNNTGAPFEVIGGVTKIKNASVGTITSDNWDGGNNGWAITKDGYANFNNVIVRGNITANTFTGLGAIGRIGAANYSTDESGTGSILINSFSVTNTSTEVATCIGEFFNIKVTGLIDVRITIANVTSGGSSSVVLSNNLPAGQFTAVSGAADVDVLPNTTASIRISAQKISGTGSWSWPAGKIVLGLHRKLF